MYRPSLSSGKCISTSWLLSSDSQRCRPLTPLLAVAAERGVVMVPRWTVGTTLAVVRRLLRAVAVGVVAAVARKKGQCFRCVLRWQRRLPCAFCVLSFLSCACLLHCVSYPPPPLSSTPPPPPHFPCLMYSPSPCMLLLMCSPMLLPPVCPFVLAPVVACFSVAA